MKPGPLVLTAKARPAILYTRAGFSPTKSKTTGMQQSAHVTISGELIPEPNKPYF